MSYNVRVCGKELPLFDTSIYYSLHVFVKNVSFPVILGAKNLRETEMINTYLVEERTIGFGTLGFIKWSEKHYIDCCVLFPSVIKLIINPIRLLNYIYIKNNMK